jgi:hypothetical protein
MSACVDIEIRPEIAISPKERAEARDSYVRSFEEQFSNWSAIAKVCVDMDRDRDWELLGFHSFGAYLVATAPRSRSYLYLVMGRFKELVPDIPEEELAEIPLGSAGVLVQMSKTKRKDPEIRKSAKKKPAEFLKDVQETDPNQHLELRHRITLDFEDSAWSVIEATFEKYKVIEGECSLETFFEWAVSEVSDWSLHAEDGNKRRKNDLDGEIVH